jgi:hypothetical protein
MSLQQKSSTILMLYTSADMPILINNNAAAEEITLKCYTGYTFKREYFL